MPTEEEAKVGILHKTVSKNLLVILFTHAMDQ